MMEQELNYWLQNVSKEGNSEGSYSYFLNADGSIRWIWPSSNSKPVFLKFYSATTLKAKCFVLAIKVVFHLKLQRFFFNKTKAPFTQLHKEFNLNNDKDWALFTGTVGINRKAIIYGTSMNNTNTFTKIALNQSSQKNIQNETQLLINIPTEISFKTPEVVQSNSRWVQIAEINRNSQSDAFTSRHIELLQELATETGSSSLLKESVFYRNLSRDVKNTRSLKDDRIPPSFVRKLNHLFQSLDLEKEVSFGLAHGDFTPWNCIINENDVHVIDWELAKENMPFGYDGLHFIIQNAILTNQQNWNAIKADLNSKLIGKLFKDQAELDNYLKLYLLHVSSYYLSVYAQQEKWHLQITWLLETWSEAISDLLRARNDVRELLIQDLFVYLNSYTYGTLKLKPNIPEQLSINSDLDIVLSKGAALQTYKKIKKNPLVKKVYQTQKSHMLNLEIWTTDNQLLSLDLIWNLRYKNWVMQDVKQVLHNASQNDYGVWNVSTKDEGEFIYQFYLLNRSNIPEAYGGQTFIKSLSSNSNIEEARKALLSILKKDKKNQGFQFLKNSLNYAIDTIRSFFQRSGYIITFSGVDGAGKSTVIEHMHTLLTKNLRKDVVLLRHRPSILPILSAWTKGKDEAEKIAASTLPRTGKNSSILSSALRFLYYYTDYLLGQFYILTKYVLRGKVVLYDRYYFDFIADPKRSNLTLPQSLAKLGYKLLLKPRFNFFLYADAETILSRKQELNHADINQLTQRYLNLFLDLESENNNQHYIPIFNTDLGKTKSTILQYLKNVAA
jgi:thymidylate kinase